MKPCARVKAGIACPRCGLSLADAEFYPDPDDPGVATTQEGTTMLDPGCSNRPTEPRVERVPHSTAFLTLRNAGRLDPDVLYYIGESGPSCYASGSGGNYLTCSGSIEAGVRAWKKYNNPQP